MKTFHANIASRPSCYDCRFKTKDRCSDFTIFDSWKPEAVALTSFRDDDKGYTNVILHTEKAASVIEKLNGTVKYPADMVKMFMFTGGMESNSIVEPVTRRNFYVGLKNINKAEFDAYIKSFITISFKDIFIEKMKRILYKLGIFNLIKKLK